MALGDVVVFEEALKALLDGTHDLDTHSFKVAILDNTVAPAAADATPALADYTEVGVAGSYVAGGLAVKPKLSEVGGVVTFDLTTDPSWAQDASNDADAYWALLYNDTDAGKAAIGFIDLAGPFDMSGGSLTVTWHANGLFQLQVAP